jgi:hypothetical protein
VTKSPEILVVNPVAAAVIESVYAPGATLAPTLTVMALDDDPALSVVGENVSVIPLGAPVAPIVTSPVKPPPRMTEAEADPDAPAAMEIAVGVTNVTNVPELGASTVSAYVAVAVVTPAPLAENVIGYVPAVTVLTTVRVMALVVAAAAIDVGAKAIVTPVGAPLDVSDTGPENPPLRTIVAVGFVLPPAVTDAEAGVTVTPMAGVGAAAITAVSVAELVTPLPVPMMLIE